MEHTVKVFKLFSSGVSKVLKREQDEGSNITVTKLTGVFSDTYNIYGTPKDIGNAILRVAHFKRSLQDYQVWG